MKLKIYCIIYVFSIFCFFNNNIYADYGSGNIDASSISGKISVGTQTVGNYGTLTATTIQATSTANVFGTTTQWNSSVVTIVGSGTSSLSLITVENFTATNTTSIMTGTNTPSPNIVLVDRTYGDGGGIYNGYYVFDNVVAAGFNQWAMNGAAPTWISYNFGTNTTKVIGEYKIAVADNTYQPTAWTFEGSNNNITFNPIDWRSGQSFVNNVYNTYTIATSTMAYQIYRLNISAKADAITTIAEMQLIAKQNVNIGVLYINGSGTVLLGTTTANSTTTAYKLQIAGSGLAASWGVTCYEAIKSIVGSDSDIIEEGYNAVMGTKLFKHHPKIRDMLIIEAETIAINEYVEQFKSKDYETFLTDKKAFYTTIENGSETVNWKQLDSDFKVRYLDTRKDEFYVLQNKDKRINDKKIEIESDTSVTNITPIADHPSTSNLFKRQDKRILDLEPQIGTLMATVQYLDLIIKNLSISFGSTTVEIKSLKQRLDAANIP